MIRDAIITDSSGICEIYNYFIRDTIITFEEEAVSASDIQQRVKKIQQRYAWLVYTENNKIFGYTYASEWKSRCAYRYSAEVTVYIHKDHAGKGIGTKLYSRLIPMLKDKGCHSLIAGIALPNDKSISFHEKFGFQKIGQFIEVGKKFEQWIDVGYWELLLK